MINGNSLKNMLSISIITPSYNQGRFIEQTIQSVLSQNYCNLEYIVMDAGSTDQTLSILKKYEKHLKWFSKKDNGQTNAINNGIKLAKGDIVAYINSDDYYLPGVFNRMARNFEKNKKVMWLTGDYEIIDEKNKRIQSYVVWYKKLLRRYLSYPLLSFANSIIQPSTFWRKSIHDDIGYFNESYRYCFDYDMWLRMYKKFGKPLLVPDALSCFRIHSLSKGGSQFGRQFQEELTVLKKNNSNKTHFFFHTLHNKLIDAVYQVIKS